VQFHFRSKYAELRIETSRELRLQLDRGSISGQPGGSVGIGMDNDHRYGARLLGSSKALAEADDPKALLMLARMVSMHMRRPWS
jgi:hypothetical protein